MIEPVQETTPAAGPCLPGELVSSTAFLLGRLGYAVKLQVMDEFERAGFSPYHYSVLALLDEGSRETQATVADALNVDRSTLVGILDGLEERELIERRRDPNDRRRHLVSLTPAGRRQLTAFRKLAKRVEGEILGPLAAADREVLHGLLLQIATDRDERFVPRAPASLVP
jgi:DNA-binding MarR family transcriptional regulator